MLGLLLCRLLYRGNVAFQSSTGGFTEQMLDRLRIAGFEWQSGLIVPLFVVFMVGLAIFAYAKRPSSQRELQAFSIYLSLAAFLVFCAIVPLNPYWIALVAPFSVLIIFANPRHLTLNSLLEVSISTSLFLIYLLVGYRHVQLRRLPGSDLRSVHPTRVPAALLRSWGHPQSCRARRQQRRSSSSGS